MLLDASPRTPLSFATARMRRSRPTPSTLSIALLAALGLSVSAHANGPKDRQNPQDRRDDEQRPQHDHQRDLSDAVRRIERQNGGQVLSAEPMEFQGRQVNRIKVVDERGRVRVIVDDPHKPRSDDSDPRGD